MSGNAPKILIVVGIVLVVLFVAGVGIGANGGLPGLSVEGVLGAFGSLMPSPPVAIADVSASPGSCLDAAVQRVIVPSLGQCVLTVGPADATVRTLALTSNSALRVRMTVSPTDGKTMTVTDNLPRAPQPAPPGGTPPPTNRLELDIFGRGGTLIIDQCLPASGSACVIDVS